MRIPLRRDPENESETPDDSFEWESRTGRSRGGGASGLQRDFTVTPRSPSEALEPDRAPEPPHGRGKRRLHPVFAFLNAIITLIFIALIGAGGTFYWVRTEFDRPGPLDHDTVVVIPSGEGLSGIAERLEREGVISNRYVFQASVRLYFHAERKLKAGEYALKRNASIRGVLDTLVSGRANLSSLSIPEGFSSQQIVDRLAANPELTGDIPGTPPEGSMLPDTYRFARGVSRDDMVRRMQAEQRKFVDKVWLERAKDSPVKTREELVTLASIVEKETGKADERRRVAAVFLNRLKKNMRLESDPTFIYGLTMGRGPLGRAPTRADVESQTPYNTYRISGLPPTPIASPGRAAIEAVIHPAKTGDLFFVADGTGGHVFAESFAEHIANVRKWREVEKRMRAEEEEKARAEAEAQKAPEAVARPAAAPEPPARGRSVKPGAPRVISEIPTAGHGAAETQAPAKPGPSRRSAGGTPKSSEQAPPASR